ncbi:MAG: FAD-dependent oxidoreductase [Moraxellaceae bacterium]|nr:MAG: FAD-dependent oxidoreductase [Moraxellaceae bacterium]
MNKPQQKEKKSALAPSTIRIGRRYRASRLDGPYDAIVIGSGIGGLTTAASMSKMGKKVLVLEQHYTAGGYTHSYSRNGYEWDVGVHYIGDVGYPTTVRKLFDFVSDNNLKWAAMDDNYDRIFLGDEEFNFIKGKESFKNELKRHFPHEAAAIDQYVQMVDKANKGMRWFTAGKLLKPWQQKAYSVIANKAIPEYFNRNTYEVLRELTSNEKLIAVLTGQWGDCGMTPQHSSFAIHSLIAKHYFNGGYYPVGGASKMAETIIPVIQASGGEVFTYASVEEILIENDRAVGVRMKDGEEIRSPLVISNAGVFNTFQRLLPEAVSQKHGYDKKLKTVSRSSAHLGMYIGLKGDAKSHNLPSTNFWIYENEHYEENSQRFIADYKKPFPVVYVSFPSAKDPTFNARYPNRSTIEIVAPAPYEIFAKWKDEGWGKRGDDYEEFKEYFSQRMLEALFEKMPHLRGKIDYYETSTPLSTDYFCCYKEGELYGLDHGPDRFDQRWLQPKSTIPGLYLTGQDVLSCGVAGAMIAGFLTACQVLGLKGFKLAKTLLVDKKETPKEWFVTMD